MWLREIAPSTELRKWFNHEPERWAEFVADYTFQLRKNEKIVDELITFIKVYRKISLLYAAKDERYTHALVLKSYLDKTI